MKTNLARIALLLMTFATSQMAWAEADPATALAPAESPSWHFPADMVSGRSVTLQPGEGMANALEKLGKPRRQVKKKKDHENVRLDYVRKIRGPLRERVVRAGSGLMTIRDHIIYLDDISLYFKNGILHEVVTKRLRADDSSESRPFGPKGE
ncbi:MAG: hypothetical protein IAF94_15565 [Pirellulaceae bacterium]|nr:hypothetical protein [Pirellulaceae bacterium]